MKMYACTNFDILLQRIQLLVAWGIGHAELGVSRVHITAVFLVFFTLLGTLSPFRG